MAAALPPYNAIYLVTLWIEAVFWGMNCIVFIGAIWIIFWRHNSSRSQWMLGSTSILLFLIVTAHVALSLRELLEAFIYIPDPAPPFYDSLYWLGETTPIDVTKTILYDCAAWIQNTVLIWRLYVVWDRSRTLLIVMLVVDLAHMAVAFAVTAIASAPGADLYSGTIQNMGIAALTSDLVVNFSVTAAIAGRLWYMGKKVSSISSSAGVSPGQDAYVAATFVIVESGVLYKSVTVAMLVLYLVGSPVALSTTNISTQLSALTPLMIIVRVGLGLTRGPPSAYKSYLATQGQTIAFASRSQTRTSGSYAIDQSDDLATRTISIVGSHNIVLRDLKQAEEGLSSSVKGRVALVSANEV